jgi:hypothetical protein
MMFGALAALGCAPTNPRHEVDTAATKEGVARLGQTIRLGTAALTPVTLEEDSRCPADVQCIQAGTVRLQVKIHEASGARLSSLALRKPLQLATGWLHLTAVCPPRLASATLSASDYLFRFMVLPNAGPFEAQDRCH